MNNRIGLLVSLLILGLMLVGGGIWWKMEASSGNTQFFPVISMEVNNGNAGSHSNLYINQEGAVIDIEIGDAQPDLGRQAFKIWKKSQLLQTEFDSLISLFKDNIDNLKNNYQGSSDGIQYGDMDTVLSISYQGMTRQIVATGYLSMYSSQLQETYAGMPSPLDKICQRLNEISVKTIEFARE